MFSFEILKIGFLASYVLGLGSVLLFLLRVRPEMKKDKMAITWSGVFCPPLLFIDLARVTALRKKTGRDVPKPIKTATFMLAGSLSILMLTIALSLIPMLSPEAKEREKNRITEKLKQTETQTLQSKELNKNNPNQSTHSITASGGSE